MHWHVKIMNTTSSFDIMENIDSGISATGQIAVDHRNMLKPLNPHITRSKTSGQTIQNCNTKTVDVDLQASGQSFDKNAVDTEIPATSIHCVLIKQKTEHDPSSIISRRDAIAEFYCIDCVNIRYRTSVLTSLDMSP